MSVAPSATSVAVIAASPLLPIRKKTPADLSSVVFSIFRKL